MLAIQTVFERLCMYQYVNAVVTSKAVLLSVMQSSAVITRSNIAWCTAVIETKYKSEFESTYYVP